MAAELDESTRRVIEAFDRLSGSLSSEESKREEAAKRAYEKMMGLAKGAGAVADVFVTFNQEIYNGKSANQAASASIHKMSDAVKVATAGLLLFMPGGIIIKGVLAALGLLASKLIDAGAAVSDQAKEVYEAYQQLAKTGATGAGAMQDVFDGLQKVGLGTEKFAAYIKLVTDNAEDLAQFGGTVNKGRKIFDSTMESFSENQRIQMELLVGGREEQAAATMGYIKQQRLLTAGTKSQMDTSSTAVERYLKETDALTRVTGLNREQQQKILDEAMSEDIFSSFLDSVRDGSKEGEEQAKRIQAAIIMETTLYGKESAKGLRDSLTGFLGTSKENEKFFMTYGEGGRQLINTLRNANSTQADVQAAFQAQAKSGVRLNNQMNAVTQMGVASDTFIKNSERRLAKLVDSKDLGKIWNESVKELNDQLNNPEALKQAKTENDARQTQLDNQRKVNLLMPAYIEGLDKATGANRTAMDSLTNAAIKAAEALGLISGKKPAGSDAGSGAPGVRVGGVSNPKTNAVIAAQKTLDEQAGILELKKKERIEADTQLSLAKQEKEDAFKTNKTTSEIALIDIRILEAENRRNQLASEITKQEIDHKILLGKRDSAQVEQNKIVREYTERQRNAAYAEQKIIDARKQQYEIETKQNKDIKKLEDRVIFFEKRRAAQRDYLNNMDAQALKAAQSELNLLKTKPQKKIAEAEEELANIKAKIRESEQKLNVPAKGKTGLADLVSRGESKGAGEYNAANYEGGKKYHKGGLEGLSSMTIGEVSAKQADKTLFAAGRYQITPDTMQGAIKALGLKPGDKFDAATQDRIFNEYLIGSKRKEVDAYLKSGGKGDVDAATLDLAKEFASIGVPKDMVVDDKFGRRELKAGEGYYSGVGANPKGPASISPNEVKQILLQMATQDDTQVASAGDKPRMATGGIVSGKPGGTEVIIGEGGLNEAVVPLPDGKSIPLKMTDNAGVSDKILAVAQVLNPTTRILASIWQAWNSTKTEAKADDSANKNKLVPFDTPAPNTTNIKTAMKEALSESNVEVISKLNELISVQKGTNSISEKMLRYAQN